PGGEAPSCPDEGGSHRRRETSIMSLRLWSSAAAWGLVAWAAVSGTARAQLTPGGAPPAQPISPIGALTSPYANPYLNPYMTQQPASRDAALLYLLSAQRQNG